MKKVLVVFIALAMVLSLCTSCNKGKSGSSSGKIKVEFWGHVNEAWNNSHKEMIAKFNASQSRIEVVATFFPYDDFEAKIQTSLMTGGSGADLYEIWGGWGLDFVASGALSQVPDDLIADLLNDCYEPVLGAFQGAENISAYRWNSTMNTAECWLTSRNSRGLEFRIR